MKILVTGSTGLIGSSLMPKMTASGHEVIRAVRRPTEKAGEVFWNPMSRDVDDARLAGIDAAINLAGESIAERWDEEKKRRIRDSRVVGTRLLAEAMARLDPKPRVLIAISAIGYYGNRADETLDEDSTSGSGFLAEVCREVEAATLPASEAGIRVVKLRVGVVLSKKGGALAKMLTPFKLGLGGRVGNGKQYFSWIALDDVIGIIEHVVANEKLAGPVNAVSPAPVTNLEFTETLGRVLSRPTIFPVPAAGLRLAFGREMADETLLSSARVLPARLIESGYKFEYPTVEAALRHVLV